MGESRVERTELGPAAQPALGVDDDESRLFRALVEGIDVGIRVDDSETRRIAYVNAAYAALWSLPRATLQNDPAAWLGAVHSEDRARVFERRSRAGDHATCSAITYRLVQPDGGLREVRERIVPLADCAGGDSRRLGVVEDVTESSAVERSIRHDDRLVSIGTMTSGIVHDLSNPIATILLLVGNALQENTTAEERQGCLRRIGDEAKRCGAIVKSVLTLAREEALEKQLGDLNATVRQATTILEHRFRDCGVAVELQLGKNLPELSLNRTGIQQAVVNILQNCCDAGALHVRVSTYATQRGVRIVIEDDGDGLSEMSRRRMFEPFFTTRPEHGGSGLGLSLARRIIADHAGAIRLEPRSATGTRVVLDIPAAERSGTDATMRS